MQVFFLSQNSELKTQNYSPRPLPARATPDTISN